LYLPPHASLSDIADGFRHFATFSAIAAAITLFHFLFCRPGLAITVISLILPAFIDTPIIAICRFFASLTV